VRARHPLEGRALALMGWMRRGGRLELILVLPDDSRALIPAAWTDLGVCPRNCVGMSERNRHVYDHAKQDHEEHD